MDVPDYLTYYFREIQKPFEVITDLDPSRAVDILRNDSVWRVGMVPTLVTEGIMNDAFESYSSKREGIHQGTIPSAQS